MHDRVSDGLRLHDRYADALDQRAPVAQHAGLGDPGADGVHRDPLGREVRGDGPDQADHPVFADRVHGVGVERHDARDRGGGQDHAVAIAVAIGAPAHGPHGRHGAEDDTVEVHADRPPVVGQIERADVTGPCDRDAGVEQGEVQAAEILGAPDEGGVDLRGIGHVTRQRHATERVGDLSGRLAVDVEHTHLHAFGGQPLRTGPADPDPPPVTSATRPASSIPSLLGSLRRPHWYRAVTTVRLARCPSGAAACTTDPSGPTGP